MNKIIDFQNKERLIYIDRLRGISIFLVVFGHFIQYNVHNFEHNILFSVIYSFHMPLFMFISGYITQKTTNVRIFENYFGFIKKKAVSLLLPFFSWQLIVAKLFFIKKIEMNVLEDFLSMIKYTSGLWFLWFLFLLIVLYSVFLFLSGQVIKKTNFIADTLISIFLLFSLSILKYFHAVEYIDSLIMYFIFFFTGVFISKFSFFRKVILNERIFFLAFLLLLVFCGQYNFTIKSTWNLALKFLISFSAISWFYYFVNNSVFSRRIDEAFIYFGQNSLIIYASHFYIIKLFDSSKLASNLNTYLLILIASACSLIAILFSIFIFKIVEKSSILNYLLFGGHKPIPPITTNNS